MGQARKHRREWNRIQAAASSDNLMVATFDAAFIISAESPQQTADINRKFDVPYLAGASADGKTIYIDKQLPATIKVDGKEYDPTAALVAHESAESAAMRLQGENYQQAHRTHGLVAEKAVVELDGINWPAYNKALHPLILAAEARKDITPPPDLDKRPYHDSHDRAELAKLSAADPAGTGIPPSTPTTPSGSASALDVPDRRRSPGNGLPKSEGNPRPRFSITAYNGGAMRLTGWKFPVVIDGEGVKLAAASIPIYAPHAPEGGPDVVECLVGQTGTTTVVQGCIKAEGIVTGESTTVKNVLAHARNGFKWQASINAMPTKVEFLLEGRGLTVNGKAIVGPCVVARAVTMDHIALVPLGADPTTSACIAASQPAGKDGTNMEFAAWLEVVNWQINK